jgi:hypothetical protein
MSCFQTALILAHAILAGKGQINGDPGHAQSLRPVRQRLKQKWWKKTEFDRYEMTC